MSTFTISEVISKNLDGVENIPAPQVKAGSSDRQSSALDEVVMFVSTVV